MQKVLKALFLFCCACHIIPLYVWAAPAKRVTHRLLLRDGTPVETVLRGDETMHFFESADGKTYMLDGDGYGRPVCSDSVMSEWSKRCSTRNQDRTEGRAQTRSGANSGPSFVNPSLGQRRSLVILVEFNDVFFQHSKQELDNFFNKEGYSGGGNTGSVHDYFDSQSYSQLDWQFDVIGPVRLSHNMRYYGANDYYGADLRPGAMVIEACHMADSLGTDFSRYDSDSDGCVEHVFILYAGYGENQGAATNTVWPHEWTLDAAYRSGDGTGSLTLDSVKIDWYACSNELHGTVGKQLDGIGSFCHELSHSLGLPDFYDPNRVAFGMNSWSVMDYGCYNGEVLNGATTPIGYTSFERMSCGWLVPQVLTAGQVTGMPPLDEQPCAYILYNDACHNEFYLLENRQKQGWDKWMSGHGMLILHVDYNETNWTNNNVNGAAGHQRMTVIPADNRYKSGLYVTPSDLAGDPWPGTSGNTALTDCSVPAAATYNDNAGSKYMHHSIEDIVEDLNGLISFSFDVPTAVSPTYYDNIRSDGTFDLHGRHSYGVSPYGLYVGPGRKFWDGNRP